MGLNLPKREMNTEGQRFVDHSAFLHTFSFSPSLFHLRKFDGMYRKHHWESRIASSNSWVITDCHLICLIQGWGKAKHKAGSSLAWEPSTESTCRRTFSLPARSTKLIIETRVEPQATADLPLRSDFCRFRFLSAHFWGFITNRFIPRTLFWLQYWSVSLQEMSEKQGEANNLSSWHDVTVLNSISKTVCALLDVAFLSLRVRTVAP